MGLIRIAAQTFYYPRLQGQQVLTKPVSAKMLLVSHNWRVLLGVSHIDQVPDVQIHLSYSALDSGSWESGTNVGYMEVLDALPENVVQQHDNRQFQQATLYTVAFGSVGGI